MLVTCTTKPPRRCINFYISIRQVCGQYRGKLHLNGFVPSVDTAVELNAIRSRITSARGRPEMSVSCVQVSSRATKHRMRHNKKNVDRKFHSEHTRFDESYEILTGLQAGSRDVNRKPICTSKWSVRPMMRSCSYANESTPHCWDYMWRGCDIIRCDDTRDTHDASLKHLISWRAIARTDWL